MGVTDPHSIREVDIINRKLTDNIRKMRKIKIEKVTEKNLSDLRDVNEKIFPILSLSETSEDLYDVHLDDEQGFALLGYLDGKVAGAACCQFEQSNSLYIRFIGTLHRYRRKGVASTLMATLFKEAVTRDVHNVFTYIRVDNKAALHMCRKFQMTVNGGCPTNASLQMMEKVMHQGTG